MSLQFLVYASPLYLLLWSAKIKHGITYGGGGCPLCFYICQICDDWVRIQRIHFNMLNQLWSLGLTKQHFKGISTSVRVQRAFIWKTHSVPRSVPLNPAVLMYHIVAPFSTVIPTLSPSPMEVIRRALFMLDHCTSEGLGITTAMCHMQLLCGSLEMTWISPRCTEFTVGSPVQQEPKQWWRQGRAERDVLQGRRCCEGM